MANNNGTDVKTMMYNWGEGGVDRWDVECFTTFPHPHKGHNFGRNLKAALDYARTVSRGPDPDTAFSRTASVFCHAGGKVFDVATYVDGKLKFLDVHEGNMPGAKSLLTRLSPTSVRYQ